MAHPPLPAPDEEELDRHGSVLFDQSILAIDRARGEAVVYRRSLFGAKRAARPLAGLLGVFVWRPPQLGGIEVIPAGLLKDRSTLYPPQPRRTIDETIRHARELSLRLGVPFADPQDPAARSPRSRS